MSSSPFRGGMPKNYDSGGSSSETEHVICLTMMEKKLRSTASKTKNKIFGTCSHCGQLITGEKQRVEIAIPTTVNSSKFSLSYDCHGVAKLHNSCWKVVYTSLNRRGRRMNIRTSGTSSSSDATAPEEPKFDSLEKNILKAVAESAEFYDPMVTVSWEAIRIARLIKSSRHCIVFTGAGISTAAGIGDYRGKSGKWTSLDLNDFVSDLSLKKEESSEEVEDIGVDYENLRPTYTHEALKILLDMGFIKYIISQNGDGLHKLSGVPNDCISELHGNVYEEYCEECGTRYSREMYTPDDIAGEYYDDLLTYGKTDVKLPKHAIRCKTCSLTHRTGRKCDQCGGYLLDTIINFGDDLEEDILERAEKHAAKTDLVISLGSTMSVTPANGLVTRNKTAGLVVCNRQKTDFDSVCDKTNSKGIRTGSRVFSDCDLLMKCIMSLLSTFLPSLLLNTNDLIQWEGERDLRMKKYDSQRQKTSTCNTEPSTCNTEPSTCRTGQSSSTSQPSRQSPKQSCSKRGKTTNSSTRVKSKTRSDRRKGNKKAERRKGNKISESGCSCSVTTGSTTRSSERKSKTKRASSADDKDLGGRRAS
ncbi:hypothetical protein ACHWQZ_G009147 [Mnemiopsis leidyi]